MEIKNFVKIYDNIIPLDTLSNLIKCINKINFTKALVGSVPTVDFNIRRTYNFSLNQYDNSLTNVHWANVLRYYFTNNLKNYFKDLNIHDYPGMFVNDIQVLKYENTGFYSWHTDHFNEIPRTMSCILLLNNDYIGGNLCFRNPDESGEWEVEVKPNRMIIWPSNFLYPHTVKPVTKGTRYSVVAWAL
jgi:hypothetical protein